MENAYRDANRALWDAWTPHHVDSQFYDMEAFRNGKSSLNAYELDLLGDVDGKSLLHLQCHFGQDTLSLARMGANATGLDLSPVAIETGTQLAAELGINAQFVCSDVLEMDTALSQTYDIVFSSYGVVGWLPTLERWGQLVANALNAGGRFVLVEFHPVLWMLDDNQERFAYSYFNHGADIEKLNGSYAAPNSGVEATSYYFNHGLAETMQALLNAGLQVRTFKEYDTSPYAIFGDSVQVEGGYQPRGHQGTLPLVFGVEFVKP